MKTVDLLKEQWEQNQRISFLENNVGVATEQRLQVIEAEQIVQNDDIARLKGTVTYVGSINGLTDPNNTALTKQELENYVAVIKGRAAQEGDVVMVLDTGYEYLCTVDAQGNTSWVVWNTGARKIASRTELGIVKVGNTLTINDQGVLNFDQSSTLATLQGDDLLGDDYLITYDRSDLIRKFIKVDDIVKRLNQGSGVPTGTVSPFAGTVAPTGYLLCKGQEVSIVDYPDLYDVIGDSYGTSSDPTTVFKLPDLNGKVITGLDANDTDFNEVGKTGGEKEHTLTTAEMPKHTHKGNTSYNGTHSHNMSFIVTNKSGKDTMTVLSYSENRGSYSKSTDSAGSHNHTMYNSDEGGGGSHNNLQPYVTMNYIIKT